MTQSPLLSAKISPQFTTLLLPPLSKCVKVSPNFFLVPSCKSFLHLWQLNGVMICINWYLPSVLGLLILTVKMAVTLNYTLCMAAGIADMNNAFVLALCLSEKVDWWEKTGCKLDTYWVRAEDEGNYCLHILIPNSCLKRKDLHSWQCWCEHTSICM